MVAHTVSGQPATRTAPAPDVQSLLADLGHATHLHVLDITGVEIDATDESVQDLRRELIRTDLGERAVPSPDR